jgi:hypothetical protein
MFVFTFFKINLKNIGVYIILIFFLHIFYMDKQIFSFVVFICVENLSFLHFSGVRKTKMTVDK